jgi:pimeloyl-ACP methyl ester carboxylesterase
MLFSSYSIVACSSPYKESAMKPKLHVFPSVAALAVVSALLLAVPQAARSQTRVADASVDRLPAATWRAPTALHVTHHRTAKVDGVDLFYREAGAPDAPVVVLLHGFPSSSHMFRNLIPALADRYRVIAPDYPGFGHSAMPDRRDFAYGFGQFADLVDSLLGQLGAQRYALYVMDYGAPVGYRLALRHPERVSALVVQNGNAYDEGLREFWEPIKAYWAEGSAGRREALRAGTTLEATRFQYLDGVQDTSRVDPAAWLHDQALLDRVGNVEIQLDLFKDYASNVALYPSFQRFFRERRPPTLIVWGRNDKIFPPEGAHAYLRDLPEAELHLLDTGHFALEDKGDQIAGLMRDFLDRKVPRR